MIQDISKSPKSREIIEALKLVLVSLDSMLIPGVEAEKMGATRGVITDCIRELEECDDERESHQTDD